MRAPVVRVLLRFGQVLVIVAGSTCFAWMSGVHVRYLATLDHGQFTDSLGAPTVEWLWPHLFLPFVPRALWQLRDRLTPGPWLAGLVGLAAGLWFNVLLLTVPYLGAYPSLPVIILCSHGQTMDAGAPFIVPILTANVVLWTCVGLAARTVGTVVGIIRPPIPTVRTAP